MQQIKIKKFKFKANKKRKRTYYISLIFVVGLVPAPVQGLLGARPSSRLLRRDGAYGPGSQGRWCWC